MSCRIVRYSFRNDIKDSMPSSTHYPESETILSQNVVSKFVWCVPGSSNARTRDGPIPKTTHQHKMLVSSLRSAMHRWDYFPVPNPMNNHVGNKRFILFINGHCEIDQATLPMLLLLWNECVSNCDLSCHQSLQQMHAIPCLVLVQRPPPSGPSSHAQR